MYFQISKYSHNIYIYRLILCQGYKLLLAWDILPDLALAVFCPSFNFRSWQPAGPGFGNISGSLGGSPLPTLDTDRSPWMISETSIILKRNKGGLVNGGLGGLVSLMIHSNGPSCCKTCVWTLAQCVMCFAVIGLGSARRPCFICFLATSPEEDWPTCACSIYGVPTAGLADGACAAFGCPVADLQQSKGPSMLAEDPEVSVANLETQIASKVKYRGTLVLVRDLPSSAGPIFGGPHRMVLCCKAEEVDMRMAQNYIFWSHGLLNTQYTQIQMTMFLGPFVPIKIGCHAQSGGASHCLTVIGSGLGASEVSKQLHLAFVQCTLW